MTQDVGRGLRQPALVNHAPTGHGPAGFDPARKARCCYCQSLEPSSDKLPFFEFRGDGSRQAREACRVCKCYEVAHRPRGDDAPEALRGKISSVIGTPHPFEPHGPWEFDSYYCGCRGWE